MRPLAALWLVAGCTTNNLSVVPMDLSGPDLVSFPADLSLVACSGGGGGLIPKTACYTGPHNDPMLSNVMLCPDASLEPNDTPSQAVPAPSPIPDTATPKITKMAICPTGPRPETGKHDIDLFVVDTTTFAQPTLTFMTEIFYDVSYGDLDVGIFDHNLQRLASDGSAVTNGCVATTVTPGRYYAIVVGANDVDVNRYDIRMRTFSSPMSCP